MLPDISNIQANYSKDFENEDEIEENIGEDMTNILENEVIEFELTEKKVELKHL